jgi:hypothetical protein
MSIGMYGEPDAVSNVIETQEHAGDTSPRHRSGLGKSDSFVTFRWLFCV